MCFLSVELQHFCRFKDMFTHLALKMGVLVIFSVVEYLLLGKIAQVLVTEITVKRWYCLHFVCCVEMYFSTDQWIKLNSLIISKDGNTNPILSQSKNPNILNFLLQIQTVQFVEDCQTSGTLFVCNKKWNARKSTAWGSISIRCKFNYKCEHGKGSRPCNF